MGLLMLLTAGAAMAYTYPTVTFNFTPATYTYAYTVTVTPSDDFPLGYLELDTLVKNLGITAWTMAGPTNVAVAWSATSFEWAPGCDAANWYVDKTKGQAEIYPSSWVGVFTLIAPNTQPGQGFGLTMDGAVRSQNSFTVTVPGPQSIPEPSSLVALGSGLLTAGGILLKRRKTL